MSWDEALSNILMFLIGVLMTLLVTQFFEAGKGHDGSTDTPPVTMEGRR